MSQRQAKRQRQKERRAERLEAERRARLRRRTVNRGILFTLAGLGAVAIFVLIARPWAGDDETSDTSAGSASSTSTTVAETTSTVAPTPQSIDETLSGFRDAPVACDAEAPELPTSKLYGGLPALTIEPTDLYTVEMVTSCGTIMLELDATIAPQTVNALVFLVEEGYFDGTVFHRLAPGFVLQGGDPTATGSGGPGFTIPDELPADSSGYVEGALDMANGGPNTTGSQFFILLEDAGENLPASYSLFGTVTDGMDVLDAIKEIPTDPGGAVCCRPLEAVYIESMTVTGHEPKPVPETTTTAIGTETTAGAETTATSS